MRLMIATLLLAATPLVAQMPEGDQHWQQRHEGQQHGRAKATHIDAAIAAYSRAVAASPNDLEARWKLLRAYRFKGAYVAASNDEKKQVYGQAKKLGAEALAVAEKRLGVNAKKSEKDVAAAARAVPGAGEIYLWDAVNWGEWALAYGKMAAAREGAADRIRRGATIALLVNPGMEGGTPARVLGRLHDQTPRIPFITGWASEKEALRFLQDSLRIESTNKITLVFLAEALASSDKPRAVDLLKKTIAAPADPNYATEDAAAIADAKRLLARLQ
ncbi:MAG TPA: hypothetical protein VF618_15840 [Thermoanaerobaculia bacterium]